MQSCNNQTAHLRHAARIRFGSCALICSSVLLTAGCRGHHSQPADFPSIALLNERHVPVPLRVSTRPNTFHESLDYEQWSTFGQIAPGQYSLVSETVNGREKFAPVSFTAKPHQTVLGVLFNEAPHVGHILNARLFTVDDTGARVNRAEVTFINADYGQLPYDVAINRVVSDDQIEYGASTLSHVVESGVRYSVNCTVHDSTAYAVDDLVFYAKSRGVYFVVLSRKESGQLSLTLYSDEHLSPRQ